MKGAHRAGLQQTDERVEAAELDAAAGAAAGRAWDRHKRGPKKPVNTASLPADAAPARRKGPQSK